MAALASLPPGEAIPVKALANLTEIPVHYLSKIMRRLVVEKLASSRKGPGGGFALGRPARRISFAQILAASDAAPEEGACAYGWGQCNPQNCCPLHHTYSQLNELVHGWLKKTTLAEVEKDPRLIEGAD